MRDDPFEQVVTSILKVLESWSSPQARFFREYVGVAEDWGHLIDVSLGMLPKSSTREIAALYLYRLRLTTGAEFAIKKPKRRAIWGSSTSRAWRVASRSSSSPQPTPV